MRSELLHSPLELKQELMTAPPRVAVVGVPGRWMPPTAVVAVRVAEVDGVARGGVMTCSFTSTLESWSPTPMLMVP